MIPVMIVTLCRYDHFMRCIESLRNNSYASDTELYIGLDYPAKESHWSGYGKIVEYLNKGIEGFKSVHVIKHKTNLGPTKNYEYIKKIVTDRHDSYIFTEDDNVFSPNFLEFMNVCMNYYKSDKKILAVCGYMYPISVDNDLTVIRISTYFSASGYGISREMDDMLAHNINMETFVKMYHDVGMMNKLRKVSPNQYCNFVKGMVEYTSDLICEDSIRPTDLAWGLYAFFNDYKVIFPCINKVRNNGYDGSGVNCGVRDSRDGLDLGNTYREYDFSRQCIDTENHFNPEFVVNQKEESINKELCRFFTVSFKELLITMITYWVSLIVGRKRMSQFIKKVNKR